MAILALHHIQLAMPLGQESLARDFFIGLLGFKEIPKPANLAKRGGCWFQSGDVHVHLGVETPFTPARKAHPALLVDDLAQLETKLKAAGCEMRPDEPLLGFARTYVSDPFGNRIELMQKTA